jgi:glutathione peroxidase
MLCRRVFFSFALILLAILSIGQFSLGNADEEELPISLYDIVETDNAGNELKMETLKGKVLFIINTATRCPYTKEHFSLFRRLFKYRRHGLEIILAPSNQFMQEPGDDKSIMIFAKKQLFSGIILTKGDVNGKSARTLFKFLKDATGKKFIEW